jgi:hypothetical protein
MLIGMLAACTEKKNVVGFEGGPEPREIIISEIFSNTFSYKDSLKAYSNNPRLITGNYEANDYQNELKTLFKITVLPDTVSEYISTISIDFVISERYNCENIEDMDLKFGKLKQPWIENEATWFAASDTTSWNQEGADYEEIELNFTEIEDTLRVELPENLMNEWINDSETSNGIVMYSEVADSFFELYSAESINPPRLKFEYMIDDETISYSEIISKDTSIAKKDNKMDEFDNKLIVSNIQPIDMFIKFDLDSDYFINHELYNNVTLSLPDIGIEDEEDFKRMTINKAELVLYPKEDNLYPLSKTFSIKPFIYLLEDPTLPILEDDLDDMLQISSSDSTKTEEFKVDVTKLIQAFTSEEHENNGILLQSLHKHADLRFMEFCPVDHPEPQKRPKLKILYTPPHFAD